MIEGVDDTLGTNVPQKAQAMWKPLVWQEV